MARKSRKDIDTTIEAPVFVSPVFFTALYIRLSVEDNKKRGNSLESQQAILENYVTLNPELKIFDTNIDNGTTGTNFDRDGFKRMMADVEAEKVNCIIVKDLSRLGRNAVDTGYYIEKYFPLKNVRFIAVNDNFDTSNADSIHGGIILPLKNLINEAYSLDIGRKIKAQARQSMKEGQYIGARPPYGYLKAPNDCHKLIIDPETAPVVRQIFEWAYEKAGLNTIVLRLNNAGIIPPSNDKHQKGLITHDNLMGKGKWQTFTVTQILSREVYTGDMVQGKSKIVNHKQVPVDKEHWIVVRDTHEAIVSRDMFEAVQAYREQVAADSISRRKSPYTDNDFKGKIFCACCGKPLHRQRQQRKKGPDAYYFHCIAKSRIGENACESGTMLNEIELREKVLVYLRGLTIPSTGENLLSRQNNAMLKEQQSDVSAKVAALKLDVSNKQRFLQSLYENLVKGVISKNEYFAMKSDYEGQITASMNDIAGLESGLKEYEAQAKNQSDSTTDARTRQRKSTGCPA